MNEQERDELISKRAAALKAADEARALGLQDVELRHWQEVVKCLCLEMGVPIPASLQGDGAPKP